MAKIVKIGSSENKDKRLLQLTNNLNTLKASLANMIEQYENEGAEEKKLGYYDRSSGCLRRRV